MNSACFSASSRNQVSTVKAVTSGQESTEEIDELRSMASQIKPDMLEENVGEIAGMSKC